MQVSSNFLSSIQFHKKFHSFYLAQISFPYFLYGILLQKEFPYPNLQKNRLVNEIFKLHSNTNNSIHSNSPIYSNTLHLLSSVLDGKTWFEFVIFTSDRSSLWPFFCIFCWRSKKRSRTPSDTEISPFWSIKKVQEKVLLYSSIESGVPSLHLYI